MAEVNSYDIYVLGLKDPSEAGRNRFATTMERLTGRSSSEFDESFPSSKLPVFEALDREDAIETAEALGETGILIEVRPTDKHPQRREVLSPTERECPSCNHIQPATNEECIQCGVVFKKFEREQLLKMQKDHTLEQAMIKAMQLREEWVQRAQQYLQQYKLPPGVADIFSNELVQEEVPFLRLNSDEGPILMTSRRMLTRRGKIFESIPYEMIDEVEFGGGKIQTRKSKFRLQVIFHAPILMKSGEMEKSMTWHLDKDSSFKKEVVFDWGYARNFICGTCGERDLEYRNERNKVHFRCMHCATDHEVDLEECVAVPLIKE
jgi:hypothetical protein